MVPPYASLVLSLVDLIRSFIVSFIHSVFFPLSGSFPSSTFNNLSRLEPSSMLVVSSCKYYFRQRLHRHVLSFPELEKDIQSHLRKKVRFHPTLSLLVEPCLD